LRHRAVAQAPRQPPVLLALQLLSRAGLDHLDAAHGLVQTGVQSPEISPLQHQDGVELAVVGAQGNAQRDDEQRRHEQQLRREQRQHHTGEDRGQQALDQQIRPGHDHHADHAGVLRRSGHDVTHALAAVERLALGEQAQVQLLPRVRLNALGNVLARKCAPEVGHGADHQQHEQHHAGLEQSSAAGLQQLSGDASGQHGRQRYGAIAERRAHQEGEQEPAVAPEVGQHPAARARKVITRRAVHTELALSGTHAHRHRFALISSESRSSEVDD
jgi:hypothetical protein